MGLGLTTLVGQIPKLLRIDGTSGHFPAQLRGIFQSIDETHGLSVAIGLSCLSVLIIAKRLVPAFPAALVVLVTATAAASIFDLGDSGVSIVGDVDGLFPTPAFPSLSFQSWIDLVPAAFAIAIVGYSESISVARRFAESHRYSIKPDRELLALGGANALSGLFQGMVVGGGASQSAANDRQGATSRVASLFLSLLALFALLFLMPLFRNIPHAALAAIVISSAIGFIDVPDLLRIRRLREASFWLAVGTATAVAVLGLLPGLLIAVAATLAELLGRLSRPGLLVSAPHQEPEAEPASTTRTAIKIAFPLLYINVAWLRDRIAEAIETAEEPADEIELDLFNTPQLDVSGIDFLVSLNRELREKGIRLVIVNATPWARKALDRVSWDPDPPVVNEASISQADKIVGLRHSSNDRSPEQ